MLLPLGAGSIAGDRRGTHRWLCRRTRCQQRHGASRTAVRPPLASGWRSSTSSAAATSSRGNRPGATRSTPHALDRRGSIASATTRSRHGGRRWATCPRARSASGLQFYHARGFAFPGAAGSAPPLLAQHDWVHVLAGYGSTVEGEIEVFAFIARGNDDPRAFSLLAQVICLFETGYTATGMGLFEYDRGHLSHEGMAVRLADAMRGARCGGRERRDTDLMALDPFALANLPLAEPRPSLGVPDKEGHPTPCELGHAVGGGRDLALPNSTRGGRRPKRPASSSTATAQSPTTTFGESARWTRPAKVDRISRRSRSRPRSTTARRSR